MNRHIILFFPLLIWGFCAFLACDFNNIPTADDNLTILFTGDAAGEIEPCG